MPYKIKAAPKKSAFEPEQLMSRSEAILHSVERHRRWVAIGVGLVVAVALGWGGMIWYSTDQSRKARVLEYQAARILAQASAADADPSELSRRAISIYEEIISKYPKTPTAPIAHYQVGNRYFELGEYTKAEAAYQDFIKSYAHHEPLLSAVLLRLGYLHLVRDDPKAALTDFEQVIQQPNAWNKGQAYYESGRVYEGLGDQQAAIGKYESLIREFPRSAWAQEAQQRLRALGVFEPPAAPEKQEPSEGGASKKQEGPGQAKEP